MVSPFFFRLNAQRQNLPAAAQSPCAAVARWPWAQEMPCKNPAAKQALDSCKAPLTAIATFEYKIAQKGRFRLNLLGSKVTFLQGF
ncbi:hypothetical protein [Vandammella animalimorsus]|nr:hypothetical protein [Vandammella animalimorsus]